jgi:prevent-host-death family protein
MNNEITGVTTIVPAFIARTQFGQILDRVFRKQDRFLISKRGQARAIIMSVEEYAHMIANQPEALVKLQEAVQEAETDKPTVEDIEAKIQTIQRGQ